MRVPLPWLGEYVALPDGATAASVAADLVRVGLEEEAIHGGDITGPLVVGRVLELTDEPQKNGKTIRWCQVDVGEHNVEGKARGIVCGAHNFVEGDLVVVSLPGAVLAGGFEISARRTYGHVSDGMICSAAELGLGADSAGIIRLREWGFADPSTEPPVGTDAIALLGLGEQTLEVNVTPRPRLRVQHPRHRPRVQPQHRCSLHRSRSGRRPQARRGRVRRPARGRRPGAWAAGLRPVRGADRAGRRRLPPLPALDAAPARAGRHAAHLAGRRRHQLRHARGRPAAARL
jgi:tRNA-binding EMAP/Myf-like protein